MFLKYWRLNFMKNRLEESCKGDEIDGKINTSNVNW